MLAGEAQVAVGVVLQNEHAVFLCQGIHLFALFPAHRDAGGVLEIRDGVDEAGARLLAQDGLQLFHVHAVRLHRHAAQAGVVGAETVERADEARRLTDDDVALVAHRLREQIHDLLRAGRHEHRVKAAAHVVLFLHVGRDCLAQGGVSLRHAVLQRIDRPLGKDARRDLDDFLHGEGLRGGVAGRKGDNRGIGRVFEDFADRRRLQRLHAVREFVFHVCKTSCQMKTGIIPLRRACRR